MLTGKLWLDYGIGEDREHWDANVTRAIFRDDEIVLEFSGHDPEEGLFSGEFKVAKSGTSYLGKGSFTAGRESNTAGISLKLTKEAGIVYLIGTWRDTGDSESYELTAELKQA